MKTEQKFVTEFFPHLVIIWANLWDKTPRAAYAERVEVFIYLIIVYLKYIRKKYISFISGVCSGISLGALGRGKSVAVTKQDKKIVAPFH